MAQEIGALFYLTSPKKGVGINELFEEIGYKIINSNGENIKINNENNEDINNNNISRKGTQTLSEKGNKGNKKQKCCNFGI